MDQIRERERRLTLLLSQRLKELPGVRVYAGPKLFAQCGLISFVPEGRDVEEIADALAKRGIAVRAGLHCAPLAHKSAGTLNTGTIRVSFSSSSNLSELLGFLTVLEEILA